MVERAVPKRKTASGELTVLGFMWRLIASLLLVFSTYNPSGYSYFDWVRLAIRDGEVGPEHLIAGIVLLIGWTILVVATKRSLETLGTVLGIILLGALVWLLIDFGLLHVDSVSAISWVILTCISVLLTIGLSWSHIWRRLTGQVEVDDN
jgi:uncharacterized membrane protein